VAPHVRGLMEPLFDAGTWRCVELVAADAGALQRFYDANPDYHLAAYGELPPAGTGRETFDWRPPAEWRCDRKWVLGFYDDDGDTLIGMADVLTNLLAEGVWHIGLFIVATALHGNGTATVLYDGLEAWMIERGAQWARLGVVEGNARAERFWERLGYREVRRREGVDMGMRINTIRVMVKPLGERTVSDYLAAVARDRPGSP
jgi:GNAT superfamily N-acetyltransferase